MISPYNKTTESPRAYFIQRGYAYVVAETRGTGSSEGVWDFGSDRERRDGYEQVEWVARQRWSSGAVGMIGDSYRGINQWWTAMEQPPHLKAIIPINPPADMYRTGGAAGGELSSLVVAQSLVYVLGLPPGGPAMADPRRGAYIASSRPIGLGLAGTGTSNILVGGAQSFDSPYYHRRSGYWNADRIKVPTFVIGGWFDIAQRDTQYMYEELDKRGVPVQLLMGPWFHTGFGADLPTPPSGGLPYTLDQLALRWFDRWVLGRADRAPDPMAPVTYHRLAEGRYQRTTSWPPADVHYRRVYLGGPAAPGAPGSLSERAPTGASSADALPWHPASGACARSSRQAALGLIPETPCDSDGAANDLTGLAYDLPAAKVERHFAGPIAARLFVSTTRSDAFVDVRVELVAPDGSVVALTDGVDTLSFRALDKQRSLVRDGMVVRPFHPYTRSSVQAIESGTVYEWSIEILPTAASIPAGHRLRVTIQPSDAGQAVMVGERAAAMPANVLQLHHGAEHPSSIAVPWQK